MPRSGQVPSWTHTAPDLAECCRKRPAPDRAAKSDQMWPGFGQPIWQRFRGFGSEVGLFDFPNPEKCRVPHSGTIVSKPSVVLLVEPRAPHGSVEVNPWRRCRCNAERPRMARMSTRFRRLDSARASGMEAVCLRRGSKRESASCDASGWIHVQMAWSRQESRNHHFPQESGCTCRTARLCRGVGRESFAWSKVRPPLCLRKALQISVAGPRFGTRAASETTPYNGRLGPKSL